MGTTGHVERSPSLAATSEPGTCVVVGVPRTSAWTFSCATRLEELIVVVASTIRPWSRSACASVDAKTGTGPQSWYGEIVS